jgi:hypothetical protein
MHHWHMTCIDGKAPLNCQRVNESRADEWSVSWAFLFQRVYNNSSCPLSDTTRTAHAEFCWRWLRRANTGSRHHQAERGHQAPQGTRGQRSPLRCQVLPPANFLCILQGLPLVSSRTWRYKYKYFSVETILSFLIDITTRQKCVRLTFVLCCVVALTVVTIMNGGFHILDDSIISALPWMLLNMKIIPNSIEQSPSWEAYSRSGSQEIPCLYERLMFITVFTTGGHRSLTLTQMSLVSPWALHAPPTSYSLIWSP